MSEPFIGEIKAVGFNFCPRGWAEADGQLLAIAQNQALFSLYGTIYGGDGRTTFALPDLRGRVPIHEGSTGPGLSTYAQGSKGGSEMISNSITLQQDNLPDVISASASATIEGITASLSDGAISGSFDGNGDHYHTVNDHTHPFTYDSFTFPDADAGVPFGNVRGLKGKTTTAIDNVGGSLRGLKEKEKENQGLKDLRAQLDDLQAQLDAIIAGGGVVGPQGKI